MAELLLSVPQLVNTISRGSVLINKSGELAPGILDVFGKLMPIGMYWSF